MWQAARAAPDRLSAAGWGSGILRSRNPSLLRAAPSRPGVLCVLPVKRTFALMEAPALFVFLRRSRPIIRRGVLRRKQQNASGRADVRGFRESDDHLSMGGNL